MELVELVESIGILRLILGVIGICTGILTYKLFTLYINSTYDISNTTDSLYLIGGMFCLSTFLVILVYLFFH